jgi:hypothetical protein
MSRVCQICNHPKRIDIDRDLVSGKSLTIIANSYGVDWQAVRRHKEGHLSRQLVQAYEKKSEAWAMDLLDHLRDIVNKAEAIFQRNYDKNTTPSDIVALNALREQRGTFELLAKIIAYSQTKAMEQQVQERQAKEIDLSDFSKDELLVMYKLGLKQGDEDELDILPEIDITPQPIQRVPEPAAAPMKEATPIISAPESETEIEPVPKRLPPRPTKIIPGFDSSCLRRPY